MSLSAIEVLTIVTILGAVTAFLIWGNRPSPDRFATANDLTLDDGTRAEVSTALRRTYRSRLLGGALGFVVALVLAALGGTRVNFTGGLAAILAGTLIGIALAQLTRAPDTGAVRVASLEARDADDYRPRHAKLSMGLALGVLLAYVGACLQAEPSGRMLGFVIVIPLVATGCLVLGLWLQRRIVEHTRVTHDPEHARVDDALRSSAVRAVHHATIGIIFCGTALLGVTGASWTTTHVLVGKHVAFEIKGATDIRTTTDPTGSTDPTDPTAPTVQRIWWTDFDGSRHSHAVAGLTGYQQTSNGASNGIGAILAFVTGIGALLEWRAAARSWKQPGPRRPRISNLSGVVTPTGAAS